MKWFNYLCLNLALFWTSVLTFGFRTLPPLGPLLEVRGGIWAHKPVQLHSTRLEGLKEPVTITYDSSGVPHFFAQNESDLFMAQGYVMASQRLFQMDLMTRITAGRLSEWFGRRTVKADKFFVKFGMRESARKTLESYNQDSRVANVLNSFAAGVNAYIRALEQLPPEYKILDISPEPWDALRIIHMGKQLTFGLAGRSFDHYLSVIQQKLGTEKVLDLFPEFTSFDDIIYPTGKYKLRRAETVNDFEFVTSLTHIPFFPLPEAGNGSNNWAVSAKKSTTGTSLMANDTHLGQSLPNIWYEAQLTTPKWNVYGVGLAAIPGIINGMNSKVSWGPTNGTTDVLDYFEVDLTDPELISESHKEEILVRNGKAETIEVKWSRFGVILHEEESKGLAAAWRGHSTQNELEAIYSLYESQNVDECLRAFDVWSAPVQNFVCVDKTDVAIAPVGFLPERKIGEGRFVMLPSRAEALAPSIPDQERPRLVRPTSGIVLSANQRQTGREYSHYLGWDYEDPFRGTMIRRRLTVKEKISPEDMMRIQNDSYNLIAEFALPKLLEALDDKQLDSEQNKAVQQLREWKYQDLANDRAPALFSEWFAQFKAAVFNDEYQVQASDFYPKDTRVIDVLSRPTKMNAYWIDRRDTNQVETLSGIVTESFRSAWRKLADEQGGNSSSWNFKNWVKTRLPHIGRLPGFGVDLLEMDGGGDSIRGNKGKHGAVYKFVVEHGEWPKAWIQVPGGNEGDPFTREYERFVNDWAEGKMRPVEYFKNLDEAKAKASRTIVLSP